jgi:3-oxoacyl-[acyl-carrier-protein] synthase-3
MAARLTAKPELLDRRREIVEHPFGSIKQWMNQGAFLMRGLDNVRGEFSLTALVYNLRRALNIAGAGALVLNAVADGGPAGRGILSTHLHSDGRQHDILYVDGGPSSTGTAGCLRMQGREVFRQAVQHLSNVVDEALAANGLNPSDLDWLVPHQANIRIIDAVGRKLGLSAAKTVVTIERHANTSAASIPLALEEAVTDGRIRPGHLVLMEALGGGLTWGAAIARW